MSLAMQNVSIPKTSRTVSSKYKFGDLVIGGPALVETDVVDAKKAKSKITSALVAYRARTGDTSKYTVRTFIKEDGTEGVGCWKIAEAPTATAA